MKRYFLNYLKSQFALNSTFAVAHNTQRTRTIFFAINFRYFTYSFRFDSPSANRTKNREREKEEGDAYKQTLIRKGKLRK